MIARILNPKGLALALAVGLALGSYTGWTANGWRLNARIERIVSIHAETVRIAQARAADIEHKAALASAEADRKLTEAQERIRIETRTILKEVPVYVTAETDVRYALPVGLVRLHDDAATGGRLPNLPDATIQPDAASGFADPSPVRASQLAAVIAENYGTCRIDQARLNALQNWLLTQRDIYEAH